jgi:hypothetical protein
MFSLSTLFLAVLSASADITPLLRHQGFTGPLNGRERIAYSGLIRQGRNAYQVYTYHGRYRGPGVDRGINRIIVIRNGTFLLGEYAIPMPTRCRVRKLRVICDDDRPDLPKSFTFTRRGPPAQIWFDGEVLQFRRFGRS